MSKSQLQGFWSSFSTQETQDKEEEALSASDWMLLCPDVMPGTAAAMDDHEGRFQNRESLRRTEAGDEVLEPSK